MYFNFVFNIFLNFVFITFKYNVSDTQITLVLLLVVKVTLELDLIQILI